MENNNNKKQSKFSQVMNAQLPHHLTALMIMVAFVSFIAIGFNQESYSMTQKEFGDTFKTDNVNFRYLFPYDDNTVAGNVAEGDGDDAPSYSVPYIVASSNGQQVFCYEKYNLSNEQERKLPADALDYAVNKTDSVDAGIRYILSKHMTRGYNKYVETWITQNAIWKYQKETGLDPNSDYKDSDIQNVREIIVINQPQGVSEPQDAVDGLFNKVSALVAEAKSAKSAGNTTLAITKASGDLTVTDNNYYKSQILTVSGLNGGSTYSLKLVNAPSGTKVYKNDGTEITDLNSIPANVNQFYLLVPINKVTESTKNLTVTVTGFSTAAYIYDPVTQPTTGSYQRVVAPFDESVNTGVDLTYAPNVPDTGMSTTQSVYFIGLVILLCGIGIIYANAKPRKSE